MPILNIIFTHYNSILSEKRIDVVQQFVEAQISEAIKKRNELILVDRRVEKILQKFKRQPDTYGVMIDDIQKILSPPKPDLKSVLRSVRISHGDEIFKPATAAMTTVLRYGLERDPITGSSPRFEKISECVESKTND